MNETTESPNCRRPPRALQAEWDAKLRASGFHDLESRAAPDGFLNGNQFGAPTSAVAGAAEYFRGGSHAFHSWRFEEAFTDEKDRRIVGLHLGVDDGDALGVRDIARRLKVRWGRVTAVIKRFRAFLRAFPSGVA
jgi:hypothetical protein